MLLISWNVAGLSTTIQRIHDVYKDEGNGTAFEHFLKRHQVDILCLQEHKIPSSQLSNRSEPFMCASVEGYESFWSKTTPAGMNGVVTYARAGLTKSANAAPLGSPDLDDQGRCIQTDHGEFVLFNVYAPCNGGHSVAMKMKFLQALRRAMATCEKPVILVGDLNITHRGIDKYWKDRCIVVDEIIRDASVPWKRDVAKAWPRIVKVLDTMEVVKTETMNTLTGVKFQKYRLVCTLPDGRRVHLGKHESKPEYCKWQFDFDESRYFCPDSGEERVSSQANTVSLATLTELLGKICCIIWDSETQRCIADSIAGVCDMNPPRRWLNDLMVEDEMVDAFRHFYPNAQGRFTCWNQNTNRRYENEGARIDYMLVHKSLLPRVQRGESGLRSPDPSLDVLSEEAALRSATSNGTYRPVSFEGEGIAAVAKDVLDTQFGPPHTGMIYFPPSFSDHIGVSMMLDTEGWDHSLVLDGGKETKAAQPHKTQRLIESFLKTKRPVGDATTASEPKLKKRKPKQSSKRGTILHHFGVRTG
ncbi:hypothetical protein MHU86_6643 [Fragilaria crotonensis]|nr:hypothetical protein MHU86_6643 [Fragilaria crotonensis]